MAYRYKNGSDFRQSLMVGGKRIMLVPGDVIESDRELKYVFLERVDDKTPVTAKTATVSSLFQLQHKLEKIQTESQEQKVSSDEVQSLQQQITTLKEQLNDALEALSALRDNTDKRMGMLKSAVMTLQEDVYGIQFDESGRPTEDSSKDPNFRA
jgi:chromosome segregation ATPase